MLTGCRRRTEIRKKRSPPQRADRVTDQGHQQPTGRRDHACGSGERETAEGTAASGGNDAQRTAGRLAVWDAAHPFRGGVEGCEPTKAGGGGNGAGDGTRGWCGEAEGVVIIAFAIYSIPSIYIHFCPWGGLVHGARRQGLHFLPFPFSFFFL